MSEWKLVPVEPTARMLENAFVAVESEGLATTSWLRETVYKAMIAAAPAQDSDVEWIGLLEKADQIVKNKPTWKRFIDGTPLSNDIAVWMADFARAKLEETRSPTADVAELVEALKQVLQWMPVYPKGAEGILGGKEAYEKAYADARSALAKWEGK